MITYSIIKKSELEGAHRLDAEYYQPEYLLVTQKIKNLPFENTRISNLLARQIVTGSTPKKRDCKNDGTDIKFIKTDTLREGQIVFDEADYLPLKESVKNSELKSGDIIITIIGATHDIVGRVARVFPSDPKMNINQNVALLRPKESSFSSYLSIFLQTKYGREQIWQQSRQTEQVNLNCREVENILVPLPDKSFIQKIDDLVVTSYNFTAESKKIYSQAENLLLEELGLTNFELEEGLWSVVNLSETKKVNRIDAEYFQPKYEKIIKKIYKHPTKSIDELSEFVGHSTQSPYDQNGNVAVLAQKHMKSDLSIDITAFDNYTSENLIKKNDKKFILKNDDILISSAGQPGLTCVWIGDHKNKVIPGSFVTVARPNGEVNPFYVGVFLNTIAGHLQFERDYTGSIQQYVYPVKIRQIIIPILSKNIQQKIADLVRASHEARRKVKELLEEAKRKVEEMIEG